VYLPDLLIKEAFIPLLPFNTFSTTDYLVLLLTFITFVFLFIKKATLTVTTVFKLAYLFDLLIKEAFVPLPLFNTFGTTDYLMLLLAFITSVFLFIKEATFNYRRPPPGSRFTFS